MALPALEEEDEEDHADSLRAEPLVGFDIRAAVYTLLHCAPGARAEAWHRLAGARSTTHRRATYLLWWISTIHPAPAVQADTQEVPPLRLADMALGLVCTPSGAVQGCLRNDAYGQMWNNPIQQLVQGQGCLQCAQDESLPWLPTPLLAKEAAHAINFIMQTTGPQRSQALAWLSAGRDLPFPWIEECRTLIRRGLPPGIPSTQVQHVSPFEFVLLVTRLLVTGRRLLEAHIRADHLPEADRRPFLAAWIYCFDMADGLAWAALARVVLSHAEAAPASSQSSQSCSRAIRVWI
jgi:hypothetical protein